MDKKQKTVFLRACLCVFAAVILLLAGVRLIAGDRFLYRDSRADLEMLPAAGGTGELTRNSRVEQTFTVQIPRLESVGVCIGTFDRANQGTVRIVLERTDTGETLMEGAYQADQISNGGICHIFPEAPLTGLAGVPLRLVLTADSPAGAAVSPAVSGEKLSGGALTVDGAPRDGALCLTAAGTETIWFGVHYWEIAAVFCLLLALYAVIVYRRLLRGEETLPTRLIKVFRRYKFLIKQLVDRDFKAKYKRSVLGVLWSFLNPLLNMLVQYIVFSNVFRFDIQYFPVYLLCGNVMFTFFTESCGMSLGSVVGNSSLISKVYIPKYIFPLTRTLSCMINLLISLIPLFAVALISGLKPTAALLLVPYALITLTLFSLGLGMFLAAGMVFFRDIQFLWGVLTTIWMYITPIFYPVSILSDKLVWVVRINPLYYYITFMRSCIISGASPEPLIYGMCAFFAIAMLALGSAVFKKTQNKFVLYL